MATGTSPALRAGLVPRRALIRRLRSHRSCRLVLVSAPAGYGKTTVLAQWARADERPFAWVTLDPGDDDPVVLGSYLLAALAEVEPVDAEFRARWTGDEPMFSATVLPALSRLIASRRIPFVLAVDDAQHVASRASRAMLRVVADAMPVGSQLAIASRTQAPLPVARLRAQGVIVEIGIGELALDPAEAGAVLAASGQAVDPRDAHSIIERTEGWPVGVYLSGLALRADRDTVVLARDLGGDSPFIADYLRSEILDSTDPDTLRFLLRTSVLDRLCGPLCDAVLAGTGSAERLLGLQRVNLLVVPLDGRDRWYRYHQLLSDELRAELGRREPGTVPLLHARASRWYEANGGLDAAIWHAKASGDMARTGELVWTRAPDYLSTGRQDTLRRWLRDLGERQIASSSRLALSASWLSLQSADPEGMRRWLLFAEAREGADWRARIGHSEVAAGIAILHALIAVDGFESMRALAAAAYSGLPPDSTWRSMCCLLEGVALRFTDRIGEAEARLREGEQTALSLAAPGVRAACLASLGNLAIDRGDWRAAAALIEQTREAVVANNLHRVSTAAHSMSAMALLLAHDGDRAEARSALNTARRLGAEIGAIAPWFAVEGRTVQARAALLLGDPAEARLLVDEARTILAAVGPSPVLESMVESTAAAVGAAPPTTAAPETTLSTAELRVMQYLPTHLSFPQIAQRLRLSRHTVKSQALSAYRKLGVRCRADAVESARALGLIESPPVGPAYTGGPPDGGRGDTS